MWDSPMLVYRKADKFHARIYAAEYSQDTARCLAKCKI